MDKLVLGFIADVLYIKGFISYDEFQAILDIKKPEDLNVFTEKMLRGEFSAHRKGEGYITDIRG